MILAYNTNGLISLSIGRAVELLDEIGYRGIAITLDRELLNPFDEDFDVEVAMAADILRRRQFRCVIETGARFLLDPEVKHAPTLVSAEVEGRQRRVDFLCRAIDAAARLNAHAVSLWSGAVRDEIGEREAMTLLVAGLLRVIDYAAERGVTIAFEPEPGMFIDTMARYADLLDELASRQIDLERFQLTIDIGHLHCQGELPIAGQLRHWADRLANVHLEDMRRGVHEHLMFGDGEIDFPPVIAALREIGYHGLVAVELSRHSENGPAAARQAYEFLKPMLETRY
jgi:sugar phosphate isomerase/epimerase